ncbi:hypothetical protein OKW21_000504 [Catalinimonas alkaloidigena]|uniref:hypothetical protein n=1 Tax=Catalinimonas alkaloidigena TaxID=1075417 RepID=UPI002406E257|nr:hypothetical protein [Catalinimonas alkaloidigena]MDF9795241.1 hypothetical protein [Catalinimonas alkaloidigena]
MTDVYHIKAEIAMQYEHGWTIAQDNFNRYLHEQSRYGNPGKKVRRNFMSSAVNK